MVELLGIKRMLTPLLKGLPFIIICMLLAYYFAHRSIIYFVPKYEATSVLKLDDSNWGLGNTIAYKDFEKFRTSNKVATEVAVIKSETVIKEAVSKIGFTESWFSVGEIRKSELFGRNNPFSVSYILKDESLMDRQIWLMVSDSLGITLHIPGTDKVYKINSGDIIDDSQIELKVTFSEQWLDNYNRNLLPGEYYFKINSERSQIKEIKENLTIVAKDKDVPILRVIYKHEVPEKTAKVANAMAEVYVTDQVDNKTQIAKKTYDFIDDRLKEVAIKLNQVNGQLEDFKDEEDIIQFQTEVTNDLRRLEELKKSIAVQQIRISTLDTLLTYLDSGSYDLLSTAPQVGFGDLLFTELFKNLQSAKRKKSELLLRYTDKHESVVLADQQIRQSADIAYTTIMNKRQEVFAEMAVLKKQISSQESKMEVLPQQERELEALERLAYQHQKQYDYLKEKKDEAGIAAAANISFHRILQHAAIPENPVSPNKTLIYMASVFIAMLTSIALVYLISFINPKVRNKDDIQRNSSIPVLVELPKKSKKSYTAAINNLAFHLLKSPSRNAQVILFSSLKGETSLAPDVSASLSGMNRKVIFLSLQWSKDEQSRKGLSEILLNNHAVSSLINYSPQGYDMIHTGINAGSYLVGHPALENLLSALKHEYEFIILDADSLSQAPETKILTGLSDHLIINVDRGRTAQKALKIADYIQMEFPKKKVGFVLCRSKRMKNVSWSLPSKWKNLEADTVQSIETVNA